MINVNSCLHNFEFSKKTELADISAVMYEATHKKSGAKLLFIDREDINKTFAISFATVPEDDTGVFHIIEHSVLCGSERYPVKEPFVELLKSSLNTFLNAMTYNDKTVYPVCSKNDRDFLNLISVYMDAVLHPKMLENEKIFMQEGWHYETDAEGKLTYNGVVFNEMKGAFSSVDSLSNDILMSMLYPNNCYGKNSGGNPDAIPKLTYEGFTSAHKKYYHPSNAKIIIDGSVKLDEVLALLDEFLAPYDAKQMNIEIADQPKIPSAELVREYEIAENEDENGKARLIIGRQTFDFNEIEKLTAVSLIRDYLTGSNEAPLKKALLDSGLCEEVIMYELDGIKNASSVIDIRNIMPENKEKLIKIMNDVIANELDKGLVRERLSASLNSFEFRRRESDFGSYPKGLVYSISTLSTWLYGGDPAANLRFGEIVNGLREKMDTSFFEDILREIYINGSEQVLLMLPSKSLAKRRAEEERAILDAARAKMSDEAIKTVSLRAEELVKWQASENTAEALSKLPTLTLDDISTEPEVIPTEENTLDGVAVLYHPISTSGIIYSTLVFDASDLCEEEIFMLSLATELMLNVATESYSALALQEKIKSTLGVLAPMTVQYRREDGTPIPSFTVKANALAQNKNHIVELVREVIYTSDFSDKATLKKILSQLKIGLEESFISAGHQAAMARAEAHISAAGAIEEYMSGYEAYKLIKKYEKQFDDNADILISGMKNVVNKLLQKSRLTVNISGPRDNEFIESLIGIIKDAGKKPESCQIKPLPPKNEAIVVPTRVAYAAISGSLELIDEQFSGSSQVARAILNYEHLWNSVRVRGGAYGAGMFVRKTGRVSFYSYRDPKPARTFGEFKKSGEFLREYMKASPNLTSLIIGAVGSITPLLSPRSAGDLALSQYFANSTYEKEKQVLTELVGTKESDILKLADITDKICESGAFSLVGNREHANACKEFIDEIIEL